MKNFNEFINENKSDLQDHFNKIADHVCDLVFKQKYGIDYFMPEITLEHSATSLSYDKPDEIMLWIAIKNLDMDGDKILSSNYKDNKDIDDIIKNHRLFSDKLEIFKQIKEDMGADEILIDALGARPSLGLTFKLNYFMNLPIIKSSSTINKFSL